MVEMWFGLLSFMLTVFVVLDGWDFGAGLLHLFVARTDSERREVIAALGPLWIWHEVWLVAAGGTFVLAFPEVVAVSFSGFYLALWMALWSFLLRGVSIEVRGHISDRLWHAFWDFVFAGSNVLLAALFGAAFGNVIRGVPLDGGGRFSMPLFTDFGVRGQVGILDWYTISVMAFAVVILAAHGATYLRLRTNAAVRERSDRFARLLWVAALVLFPIISLQTAAVRPELFRAMSERPAAWLAVVVMMAGAWAVWSGLRGRAEGRAFAGSCAIIAGLLCGAAASVFPVMLHSTIAPEHSLDAYEGAASGRGLLTALVWWPVALALAVTYFLAIMRHYRGRVRLAEDSQGTY